VIGMTDLIEVSRPPEDSGAFLPPSRYSNVRHKELNPSWRHTVMLSRSQLVSIREGNYDLLWPVFLVHKMTPKLQTWLDGLQLD
jgi:hypothetical protein